MLCAIVIHCKDDLVKVLGSTMRWATDAASQGWSYEIQLEGIISLKFGGNPRPLGDLMIFHGVYEYLKDLPCELIGISLGPDGNYMGTQAGWGLGPSSQLGYKATSAKALKDCLEAGGGAAFFLPDNFHHADIICYFRVVGTSKKIMIVVQAKFTSGKDGHEPRAVTFRDALRAVDTTKFYKHLPVRIWYLFPSHLLIFSVFLLLCAFSLTGLNGKTRPSSALESSRYLTICDSQKTEIVFYPAQRASSRRISTRRFPMSYVSLHLRVQRINPSSSGMRRTNSQKMPIPWP